MGFINNKIATYAHFFQLESSNKNALPQLYYLYKILLIDYRTITECPILTVWIEHHGTMMTWHLHASLPGTYPPHTCTTHKRAGTRPLAAPHLPTATTCGPRIASVLVPPHFQAKVPTSYPIFNNVNFMWQALPSPPPWKIVFLCQV